MVSFLVLFSVVQIYWWTSLICSVYNTKQSDGEAPVMLELWGMWSIPSLPSLPGPLWPQVVAPDRSLSMGQVELFDI